jgi:Ser/Thr protein kinase RdoA (MazF antagonist)
MGVRASSDSRPADLGARAADTVEQRWAVRCHDLRPVHGGDESLAWRATAGPRRLLLHLSPPWRQIEELGWVHALIGQFRERIPAIPVLPATDGSTTAAIEGRLLSVYPFVEGAHLDREDPSQRVAAARLLAAMHRVQSSISVAPRPPSGPDAPANLQRPEDPPELVDTELDRWHAAVLSAGLPRGLIHGDVYRRNLLWANGTIVAVVDWHDAHHDLIAREVAWSTWEFGKEENGRALRPDRPREFLSEYERAAGTLSAQERDSLVPLIRWRLREEVRRARAARMLGRHWDEEYVAAHTAAFAALRGMSLRSR